MKKYLMMAVMALFVFAFTGCSKDVSNKDITVKIDGTKYEAQYTGTLKNGKPVYSGKIEIENYDLHLFEDEFSGTYKGSCYNGIPSADGVFNCDERGLKYDGTWKEGAPVGIGKLTYSKYVTFFDGIEVNGRYVGATLDGLPSGYGEYSARDDWGSTYTYKGDWKEGYADGFGRLSTSDDEFDAVGVFTEGSFDTTVLNVAYSLSENPDLSYVLTDSEAAFISEHEELFPCDDFSGAVPYIDESLDYRTIHKGEDLIDSSLVQLNGLYVYDIESVVSDTMTLTVVVAIDNDYHYYCIYYPGELSGIYQEDTLSLVGFPIGTSYVDDGYGTSVETVILLGSYVTK
jgi:hypothetical protein